MKWKISRHSRESGDKRGGQPPEALWILTLQPTYVPASAWMRVCWPPWGGCPPETLWRAAGAMFVGF